jgi:hypothetical protein
MGSSVASRGGAGVGRQQQRTTGVVELCVNHRQIPTSRGDILCGSRDGILCGRSRRPWSTTTISAGRDLQVEAAWSTTTEWSTATISPPPDLVAGGRQRVGDSDLRRWVGDLRWWGDDLRRWAGDLRQWAGDLRQWASDLRQ